MSLKFQDIDWDENRLMYVAFDNNGETLRWYPKWKDLADVFDSAWATEHYRRTPPGQPAIRGKLSPYFLFLCLNILTRSLLIETEIDHPKILEFNRLANELEAEFRKGKPFVAREE